MIFQRNILRILALLVILIAAACQPAPLAGQEGTGSQSAWAQDPAAQEAAVQDLTAKRAGDTGSADKPGSGGETGKIGVTGQSAQPQDDQKPPAPTLTPQPDYQALRSSALVIRGASDGNPVQIYPVDLTTGTIVEGIQPIAINSSHNYAYAPDMSTLAVFGQTPEAECMRGCLTLIDLATFQVERRIMVEAMKNRDDWVSHITFDPQGRRLALIVYVGDKSRVAVVDLETKQGASIVREMPILHRVLEFSADGEEIILVGEEMSENFQQGAAPDHDNKAILLDAENLETLWEVTLEGVKDGTYKVSDLPHPEDLALWQAAMVFSSQKGLVYIAHADEDKLTTVDINRRSVQTIAMQPPRSWIDRLVERVLSIGVRPVHAKVGNMISRQAVLSADQRRLYLIGSQSKMVRNEAGEWESEQTSLGLQIWNLEQGVQEAVIESEAGEIRLSPDGNLLLTGWNAEPDYTWTDVFDPLTRQVITRIESAYPAPVPRLDGSQALVSQYTQENGQTLLSILDPHSYQTVLEWMDKPFTYPTWMEDR